MKYSIAILTAILGVVAAQQHEQHEQHEQHVQHSQNNNHHTQDHNNNHNNNDHHDNDHHNNDHHDNDHHNNNHNNNNDHHHNNNNNRELHEDTTKVQNERRGNDIKKIEYFATAMAPYYGENPGLQPWLSSYSSLVEQNPRTRDNRLFKTLFKDPVFTSWQHAENQRTKTAKPTKTKTTKTKAPKTTKPPKSDEPKDNDMKKVEFFATAMAPYYSESPGLQPWLSSYSSLVEQNPKTRDNRLFKTLFKEKVFTSWQHEYNSRTKTAKTTKTTKTKTTKSKAPKTTKPPKSDEPKGNDMKKVEFFATAMAPYFGENPGLQPWLSSYSSLVEQNPKTRNNKLFKTLFKEKVFTSWQHEYKKYTKTAEKRDAEITGLAEREDKQESVTTPTAGRSTSNKNAGVVEVAAAEVVFAAVVAALL
ncbi:hypothetical protein CAAN3_23S01090 [[Candida] anglica]